MVESDKMLISVIKRASLDMLWNHAQSTVAANLNRVVADRTRLQVVGLQGAYYDPGPTLLQLCGLGMYYIHVIEYSWSWNVFENSQAIRYESAHPGGHIKF